MMYHEKYKHNLHGKLCIWSHLQFRGEVVLVYPSSTKKATIS